MSNPEFHQSAALMRRAISENIITVTPKSIAKFRNDGIDGFKALMNTVSEQWRGSLEASSWLGQQSSWQLPTTRRYHQSRLPKTTPSVQPSSALDWLVELSRFPVPFGSVGVIKSFEQFLQRGETVYSISDNCGNPFLFDTEIRWFFRLSDVHWVASPWVNSTGLSAITDYLPGTPYDDFANTNDLWFPASSSSSANIHLPIPGGKVLRVFCIIKASEMEVDEAKVAAKLAGTIQSETNNDAQFMIRTTW